MNVEVSKKLGSVCLKYQNQMLEIAVVIKVTKEDLTLFKLKMAVSSGEILF